MSRHGDLRRYWKDQLYSNVPEYLSSASKINGVISAFNSNIDAILPMTGERLACLINQHNFNIESLLDESVRRIDTPLDLFRGIVRCFKRGIAEEWLIYSEETYKWISDVLGYERLQMGGQCGIVANVSAVAGCQNVYVHCASLPESQAKLFLPLNNLKSFDKDGQLVRACDATRDDLPLIHWIIEFAKGDVLALGEHKIVCPKSNRFIATFDPLNLTLTIDPQFRVQNHPYSLVVLSGYHMLTHDLPDGSKSEDRIKDSLKVIESWKQKECLVHLEIASTQDEVVRKQVLDLVGTSGLIDSSGLNERELVDCLMVVGEQELGNDIDRHTDAAHAFAGLVKLFELTQIARIQLHMFGLYITIQKKNFTVSPERNRNGMLLAAICAASKAGTGALDDHESLLWSLYNDFNGPASHSLKEFELLFSILSANYGVSDDFLQTGIAELKDFDVIAVPTVLVANPKTLVGMGDTISSMSLIGTY
ncbi:hypothetical protein P9112_008919 [Eukaryota sp. TZLM1-RC]